MAEVRQTPESSDAAWAQFRTKLPEEYQTDPDKFLSAHENLTTRERQAREEAEETRRYKEWYQKTYMPWLQENKTYLDEYETWKAQRGTHGAIPSSTATPDQGYEQEDQLDWEDLQTPQKAFDRLARRQRDIENNYTVLQQTFQSERESIYSLMDMLEQARQLERDALYAHVKYQPRLDMVKVAEEARKRGVRDLRLVANDLYRDQTTEEKIAVAVAAERRKWEQEQENRQTRVTPGTSVMPRNISRFRGGQNVQTSRPQGSSSEDDELYAAIARKQPDIQWG